MSVNYDDTPRGFVPKSEYYRILRERDELAARLRYHEVDKHKPILTADEVAPKNDRGERLQIEPAAGTQAARVLAELRRIHYAVTCADLADLVGAPSGVVSRVMADLFERGFVERTDGRVGRGYRARWALIRNHGDIA